jgi:hypothetical protein
MNMPNLASRHHSTRFSRAVSSGEAGAACSSPGNPSNAAARSEYFIRLVDLINYQSSVRKGEAGKPSRLYRLAPSGFI